MARTRTATRTKTVPRLSLIKIQIMAALRRGANVSGQTQESLRKGLDKRWIAKVRLYGFDEAGECWAELDLEIDWQRHQIHVTAGHEFVDLPEFWRDAVAPEVDEMVAEFVQFCSTRQLRREWRVVYTSVEDSATIRRALGFQTAEPIVWAGEPAALGLRPRELDELSATLRLVEEPRDNSRGGRY